MARQLSEQEDKARQKAFLKSNINVDNPGEYFEAGFVAGLEYQQAIIDKLAAVLKEVDGFLESEGYLNIGTVPLTPYERKISALSAKVIDALNSVENSNANRT